MSRRMTVVFHDEDLYTELKIQAIRRRKPANKIIAEAVHEWLESQEDAGLLPVIESARAEWKEKGGRPWAEVEEKLDKTISKR